MATNTAFEALEQKLDALVDDVERNEALNDANIRLLMRRVGKSGEDAIYVRLSKTLIAVKTQKSVWAEEGIDAEDSAAGSQTVILTGEVISGTEDKDVIESVEMQQIDGVEDVIVTLDEESTKAVISFVINSTFDVTQTQDAYLLFHSEKSGEDGIKAFITFVPSADGEDGSQGEGGMDAIQVLVFSESGNLRIPEAGAETIYARVYRGGIDITDDIPDAVYRWKRVSTNPHSDLLWNRMHDREEFWRQTLTLKDEDVYRRAMFECEVEFEL